MPAIARLFSKNSVGQVVPGARHAIPESRRAYLRSPVTNWRYTATSSFEPRMSGVR